MNCVWILKILIVTLPTALNIVFYFLFGDSIRDTLRNMYIDLHIICGEIASKILYPLILIFFLILALILVILATFMMEMLSFTYIVWFGYSINNKLKEKHDLLYHLIPWIEKSLQIANEHKLKKIPENVIKDIQKSTTNPSMTKTIKSKQDEISRDFKFRIYLSNFMMIPSEWHESNDEFSKINDAKKLSISLNTFFRHYQSVIFYLLYDKDKKRNLISQLQRDNVTDSNHHNKQQQHTNTNNNTYHRNHSLIPISTEIAHQNRDNNLHKNKWSEMMAATKAFNDIKDRLDISLTSMIARWGLEAETSIWWIITLFYGKCFPVRKPSMHSGYRSELDNKNETRYWKFIGGKLLLPFYCISRCFSLIYPIIAIGIWTSKEWDKIRGWSKFNNFQASLTVIYLCTLLIMLLLLSKVWTYYFIILHLPMAQMSDGDNFKNNKYINVISIKNIYCILYQNAMKRIILEKFFGDIHLDIMSYLEPDQELINSMKLLIDGMEKNNNYNNVFDSEEMDKLHNEEILTDDQLKKYTSHVIFEESMSYNNYYADL